MRGGGVGLEKRRLSNIQHDQLFSCSGTLSVNSTASLICIVCQEMTSWKHWDLDGGNTAEFKEERKGRVNRLKGTETGSVKLKSTRRRRGKKPSK